MSTVEALVWGLLGVLFVTAVIWAIVSRVRKEGREEKYEKRDN